MFFKSFLKKIDSNFSKDLFIWINKNIDFQRSYLAKYIDINDVELLEAAGVPEKLI